MVEQDSSGKFEKRVDEEWKEQARAERQTETEKTSQQQESVLRELPPPTFNMLVSGIAADALVSLGAVKNPLTGKQTCDMKTAQHFIDLLQILQDKTKGNLEESEKQLLESALYDLRMRFVSAVADIGKPESGGKEQQQ